MQHVSLNGFTPPDTVKYPDLQVARPTRDKVRPELLMNFRNPVN